MLSKIRDPKVGGAIAGVIILIAVANAVMFATKTEEPAGLPAVTDGWFYRESTKEILLQDLDAPPSDAVRAYVYTCGECKKEDERFIGYLKRMKSDNSGSEVKLKDDEAWIPYKINDLENEAALELMAVHKRHDCAGGKLVRCRPGRF